MNDTGEAASPRVPRGRRRLFRALLAAGVVLVIGILLLFAELAARFARAKQLDSRISAVERLVTSNVTYNKSLFDGYAGREAEASAHFAAYAKTPSIYRPFIEYRRVPDFHEAGININELSYRGPDFSVEKPADTFRILIYGGSFVWGTGALRDDETISAHLERRLNAERTGGLRYEVINCGETGFQTTQEIIFLIVEGVFLQPDLVVFIDGVNDSVDGNSALPAGYPNTFERFNELLTGSVRARHREAFTVDDELEYLKRVRSTLWTAGSSELLRRLREGLSEGEVEVFDDAAGRLRVEEFAIRHTHNLRSLRGIATEYDFSFVSAIQPIPMFFKPLHAEEIEAIESLQKYPNHFGMVDWWKKHYLEYTDGVISECKKRGIPMIDLRKVFEGNDSPLYIDDIHVTGDGYRIVADALHRSLVQHKVLDIVDSARSTTSPN